MKYLDYAVTFSEFPDEIALCINISNCPIKCKGCHSPELQKDIGEELNEENLSYLINKNNGVSVIGLMGGDNDPARISELASFIKNNYSVKVGWYSGKEILSYKINLLYFDYVKLGPYIKERGPIDNPNTNQRMYEYNPYFSDFTIGRGWRDITYKFWKHEI